MTPLDELDMNITIPLEIMQTSLRRPPARIIKRTLRVMKHRFSYTHFDDSDILQFFVDNPQPGLRDVRDRFLSLKSGEHKADLFRYFYLYVRGGVYFDTDVLLVRDLAPYLSGVDFLSVNSGAVGDSLFQGFLASRAGHPVLRQAIEDVCNISNDLLRCDHHLLCKNLKNFLDDFIAADPSSQHHVNLLEEIVHRRKVAKSIDDKGRIVLYHFWRRDFPPTFPFFHKGARIAWP